MVLSGRKQNTENQRRIVMKPMSTLFISFAVMLVLAGCAPGPRSGIIEWQKALPEGSVATDIPFTSMDGRQTTFRKISQPIAILAFTSTPGETCCRLLPELVTLADRFKYAPITVAQISLPRTKCSHGPGCTEVCNINDARLVALCDADRIAWKAYGRPKPGTLILIKNGKIAANGNIRDLKSIADKAQKMGAKIEEERSDIDDDIQNM